MKHSYSAVGYAFCVPASQVALQSPSYSEQEIIALHDKFLSVGFHYIRVPTVFCGRALIQTFLQSLSCYHNVAFVTALPIISQDHNVYANLIGNGYVDSLTNECINAQALDQFFIEQCEYDLIWIEESDALKKSPWYKAFDAALRELNIHAKVPVIVIRHEE